MSAILTATGRVRDGWRRTARTPASGRSGGSRSRARCRRWRTPDGYEVNATFAWDGRRLPPDEAADGDARAWAGWSTTCRRSSRTSTGSRPPTAPCRRTTRRASGRSTRSSGHLGSAAAWFAGAPRRGHLPRRPWMERTREPSVARADAWATDRVRALADGDDGSAVTDEHGETWTLAKVVRRLVYHAFEHVWDLDRRLARADGTGDRVDVRLDRRPDAPAMAALLRSVGWDGRAGRSGRSDARSSAPPEFAAAWDGDRLVGTARSLTDGAMYAHIATVVVHPRYQGLGVGERLMHLLMDGPRRHPVRLVGRARHGRVVPQARVRSPTAAR